MDCLGYCTFYPFDIQPLKALKVILLSKQFGLEPTHLAGAGRFPVRAFLAHHHSHGRVLGKAVGIIGIALSCEAAVHGLSRQRDCLMADVITYAALFETIFVISETTPLFVRESSKRA